MRRIDGPNGTGCCGFARAAGEDRKDKGSKDKGSKTRKPHGTRSLNYLIPTAQKPDSWDSQTALDVSRCCKSLIRGGQDGVG